MKQVVGVEKRPDACPQHCKMLKITETLWLCPHMAWGWTSNLRGAEAEARRLMEAAGGYDSLLKATHRYGDPWQQSTLQGALEQDR